VKIHRCRFCEKFGFKDFAETSIGSVCAACAIKIVQAWCLAPEPKKTPPPTNPAEEVETFLTSMGFRTKT
jgi:hypothetical protein